MKREFYFQDDKSNKFWTIEQIGKSYVTTHGRIGAAARETSKECDSAEAAKREVEKQIASKLKKGYLEGALSSAPQWVKPDWAALQMSDEVFWRIIRLFNWKKLGDDDAVIEPAVAALAKMTIDDINLFEELLTNKLFALDTEAHAREIGEGAYGTAEHFSVDCFLYVRCVVVANGPDLYSSVLADPKQMPKDCEFESLLSVGRTAWERKTGAEFDYVPTVSYETFSNTVGWKS